MKRGEYDVEGERSWSERGESDGLEPGLVPDLLRTSSMPFSGGSSDSGVVLSCAADIEGRNRLRGVTEPLIERGVNDVMSSPFAEGPAEEKCDPLCDMASEEEAP